MCLLYYNDMVNNMHVTKRPTTVGMKTFKIKSHSGISVRLFSFTEDWIAEFLSDRSQCVRVNGFFPLNDFQPQLFKRALSSNHCC